MRLRLLLGCLLAMLLTGCSPKPAWQGIDLPDAFLPQILALDGDALLIGGRITDDQSQPWLYRFSPTENGWGAGVPIPVTAKEPYASVADWTSLAVQDGRIQAVGGQIGGAHGNVRWSLWAGDRSGVVQLPQEFWTFGGWEMGSLIGVAWVAGKPLVAGSWTGTLARLDLAVWQLNGTTWARRPSSGTGLASTADTVVGAGALAGCGSMLTLAGSVTHLSPLSEQATLFRGGPPWQRVPLSPQRAGSIGRARAVACQGDEQFAVGLVDGQLHAWSVLAGVSRAVSVPELRPNESSPIPNPVREGDAWLFGVTTAGTGKVVRCNADECQLTVPALPAPVTGLVVTPKGTVALTTPAGGNATVQWLRSA